MFTIKTDKIKTGGNAGGYTLLEMALSMLILGILFSAAIPLYRLYIEETRAETTRQRLATAYYELQQYKVRMGAYPCPASLTDNINNATYGKASACSANATPVGSCAGGICAEEGALNVKPDIGASYKPRVLRGSLPFHDMGLTEKDAYDAYGNRFVYAITQNLTDPTKFGINEGGIQLLDGNGNLLTTSLPNVGSAQFVLLSPGPDSVGGFTRQGTQLKPCVAGTLQSENCDTTNNAIYRVSERNLRATNLFFDDSVVYNALRQPVLWRYTGGFTDVMSKDLKVVGIGTVPNSGEALAVNGNLKVTSGEIAGPVNYCEPNGTNCFPRALLGNAATDGASCPPGKYMVGFKNGAIECISNPLVGCPTGERILGFDASGLVMCSGTITPPPPACPAKGVTVCSSAPAQMLPTAPSGTTNVKVQWNSRYQYYDCVNGSWVGKGWHGSCSCTVGTTPNPVNNTYCLSIGMSGPYQTATVVTACGASYSSSTVVTTPCSPAINCSAFTPIVCLGTPVATPFPLTASTPGTSFTSPKIGLSRKEKYTCQSDGSWKLASSSGTCVGPASCPTQAATICGTPTTLPAAAHNTYKTLTHAPDRAEQYKCNNGTWVATGSVTGSCTPYLDCSASTDTICSGHTVSLPADIHGATYTEPYGSAKYKCNNGSWVQTASPSCPVTYYCDWQLKPGSGYYSSTTGGYPLSGDTCTKPQDGSVSLCALPQGSGFKIRSCRCTCVVVP